MSIEHYQKAVRALDSYLPEIISKQVDDPNRFDYGGIEKPSLGIADSEYGINELLSCYFCPDSKYYRDIDLRERVIKAVKFLVRTQHDDGTIDLYETNFHSPPDTSFRVWVYAPWVEYLRKIKLNNSELEILSLLETFLKRTIPALKSGGFHTPNHRWVQASALARLGVLFDDKECKLLAEEYLEEGIDCNEDGLFYEKSLAIYNPVCGMAMLWLAEDLGKEELIKYTKKVLDFAIHFLEKDGTVLTTFSIRQDRGLRVNLDTRYYYLYKKMSILENNGTYAEASDCIFNGNLNRLGHGFNPLHLFLFYPEFKEERIERKPLPRFGEYFFKNSGIVRINSDKYSLTFTKGSDEFLTLVLGAADIRFRYLTSFFGKGPFIGEDMEGVEDGYILSQKLEWGYLDLLPEEERGKKVMWNEMNHSLRRWIKMQNIETRIKLCMNNNLQSGNISLSTNGCRDVLTMLEVSVPKDGEISFKGEVTQVRENTFLLKDGLVRYQKGSISFELSPGSRNHKLIDYRGDRVTKETGRLYIVMTFRVPFEHKLEFSYGDV